MPEFQFRRQPAITRKIAEIKEADIRVRLVGKVIDRNESAIVLDDGTGTAEIVIEPETVNKAGDLDLHDFLRVFCRVIPLEKKIELRAEIIQDMTNLDVELYRKVFDKDGI